MPNSWPDTLARSIPAQKCKYWSLFIDSVHDNIWDHVLNSTFYYMAESHKDWELTNLWLWLAKIDIESGLDFLIQTSKCFAVKKL